MRHISRSLVYKESRREIKKGGIPTQQQQLSHNNVRKKRARRAHTPRRQKGEMRTGTNKTSQDRNYISLPLSHFQLLPDAFFLRLSLTEEIRHEVYDLVLNSLNTRVESWREPIFWENFSQEGELLGHRCLRKEKYERWIIFYFHLRT